MPKNRGSEPDWIAIRAEFPALRAWTYLNTATYGQTPSRAVHAVARHLARRDELACADFLTWFDDADCLRASIARLIGAGPADIAFVPNAATALGILMNGLDWRPGDRVVTLTGEFPNNLYFPALLPARGVEFVETPWERFCDVVTSRTRLVLLSEVNYTTGFRPPLAEAARLVHDRGALLYVDGTQSLGALKFDVRAIEPDMYAVDAYKWLLSPNGAGFCYIRPAVREWLAPSVVGWRSHHDWRNVTNLHRGAPEFSRDAERYEGGILNFPSLYGMQASVEMMLEIGPAAIEARVMELAASLRETLRRASGELLYDRAPELYESPIVAARFRNRPAAGLAGALKQRRILVSARHDHLRVSTHFYNNEEDLGRLERELAGA